MSKEEIFEELKKLIVEVNEGRMKEILLTTTLQECIADSLEYMNLIIKVEIFFSIEFEDEDIISENYENVDALVVQVQKMINTNN